MATAGQHGNLSTQALESLTQFTGNWTSSDNEQLLWLDGHVPYVFTCVVWYIIDTWDLWQPWPPTAANSSFEELNLFAVDFQGVGTSKLRSTQDYVYAVLFAEVFSGVMHSDLSTNLPHALHDLGEIDFDLALDLKSIIGAIAQFVGD